MTRIAIDAVMAPYRAGRATARGESRMKEDEGWRKSPLKWGEGEGREGGGKFKKRKRKKNKRRGTHGGNTGSTIVSRVQYVQEVRVWYVGE